MFRRKVEMEIDYTDILKGIRNAKIWMIFNAVLFVGGMMTLSIPQIGIIALGVLIFCPISIIKNLMKYRKFKKYLKNYAAEPVEKYQERINDEMIQYEETAEEKLSDYVNEQPEDEQKNSGDQFYGTKFDYKSDFEAYEADYLARLNPQEKEHTELMNATVQPEQKTDDNPLTILKKRYAKGEITKDEFAQIKKNLE